MMAMLITISHYVSAIGAIEWGLHAFMGCGVVGFIASVIGIKHLDTAIHALVGASGVISLLALLGVVGGYAM